MTAPRSPPRGRILPREKFASRDATLAGSIALDTTSLITPTSQSVAPPIDPPPLHVLDTPEKVDSDTDEAALQATVDAAVRWQERIDFTLHDGESWEPAPTQVTFANECVYTHTSLCMCAYMFYIVFNL